MMLKNFLSFILLFSTPLLSFSQELLIVQGDTVPNKEKGIWAFKSGDKSIEQWHTRRNTSIKDLTFRKVDLLLHTNCDDISQTYLCISSVDRVQLDSLLQITSIIQPSNKDINEEIKKECESISKADTNVTLIINLKYLLTQSFNLIDENLKDDNVHPKAMSFKNNINDRLCAFIYASDGIVFESKYLNPKRFRLIIDKTPLNDLTEDEKFNYIEPRQYMTIYEKKNRNSDPEKIWFLENNQKDDNEDDIKKRFSSKQIHSIIGNNSLLEIHFDQKALAYNTSFRGNISLKAKSGKTSIEVGPYFVTGEKQKAYGVNSKPIKEIADNYLRLMIEANKLSNIYRDNIIRNLNDISLKIETKRKESLANDQQNESTDNLIKYLDETRKNIIAFLNADTISLADTIDKTIVIPKRLQTIKTEVEYLLEYISSPVLFNVYARNTPVKYVDLNKELNDLEINQQSLRPNSEKIYEEKSLQGNDKPEYYEISRSTYFEDYMDFVKSLDRISRYMAYFDATGNATKEAFLTIANMTRIDFNTIKTNIDEELKFINNNYKQWNNIANLISKPNYELELYIVKSHLHDIFLHINEFNNKSPRFSDLLENAGYNSDFLVKNYRSKIASSPDLPNKLGLKNDKAVESDLILNTWKLHELNNNISLLHDSKQYENIRNQIAIWAGKEIFSQLIYATIDLSKANINDGDRIDISLVWYNIYDADSSKDPSNGEELATASFIVKKVGWHLEPTESALLIKRFQQDQLDLNYPISPSNFKPTAGASLLWTYHNNKRGSKCGKFFRSWEFSAGINVSYLDFNDDKDFEVGFGPVIGFFKNSILLTGGYNLSVEGLSPWYMGIGFSFFNTFGTIKSNIKKDEKN